MARRADDQIQMSWAEQSVARSCRRAALICHADRQWALKRSSSSMLLTLRCTASHAMPDNPIPPVYIRLVSSQHCTSTVADEWYT